VPDEEPRSLDPRRHVCQPEGDRLVLSDGLAELLTRLRVFDRVLERGAREAGRRSSERDARAVEGLHEAREALPLLAEPAVGRELGGLEEHLGVHDRPLPHLLHRRPELDPLVAALDHERRHTARAGPGLDGGEDDVRLGDAAVRDP
jgi:hypothetical protein